MLIFAITYTYASEESKTKESTSNFSELSQLRKQRERAKVLICSLSLTMDIKSKTPTVIEHQPRQQNINDCLSLASMYAANRYQDHPIINPLAEVASFMLASNYHSFNRHPIYFGKTAEGHPYCASIENHENNPDFDKVKLAIYQGNSIFFNPFRIIGTYSDKNKRQQLKDRITQGGGLWCPEQNTFIGGTRDKSMCNAFAAFEKNMQKPSTLKKLKKIVNIS